MYGLAVYPHNVMSENDRYMYGAIALQCDLSCNSINHIRNVSDSRTVVRYAECPYTICSFQVMYVSTHKMLYQKEAAMCV